MKSDVLGIKFDRVTIAEAVRRAAAMTEDGRPHYIVTPNPEILCKCKQDREVFDAVNNADMILPDGIGVVKAAAKLGRPLPERVGGYDFANALMPWLSAHNKRLFLLGSKPGIAEKAAQMLQAEHNGLIVCGVHDGYFTEDSEVTGEIIKAGADVVFVCLGAPKQELWMARNSGKTGHAVMVGLGGSIDHWAGVMKRAPSIFIKLNLEWLYRFLRHPSRLGRAVFIPQFLYSVRRQRSQEKH
jgi:N-acetylglucosaminyldiphosphoundecaprenol N-acetyl-beta-D-mannosaminyltransferase